MTLAESPEAVALYNHEQANGCNLVLLIFLYLLLSPAGACDVIMSRFVQYLTAEKEDELRRIAKALVAPGKGVLAADESSGNSANYSLLAQLLIFVVVSVKL